VTTTTAAGRTRLADWLLATPLLVVLAAALQLPGILLGPSRDPGVFASMAHTLLDGVVPYAGAWDHKPPVTYLVMAVGQLVLPVGDPWVGSWLISVLVTAATGLATVTLARRMGLRPVIALIAGLALVAAVGQYALSEGGGFSEQVAACFAAWALVVASGTNRRWVAALVAGSVAALAVGSSPILGSAVVAAFVLSASGAPARRVMATRMVSFLAGAAIAAGLLVTWLAAEGALSAAWNEIITYNVAYRASESDVLGQSVRTVFSVGLLWLFVLVPAAIGLVVIIGRRRERPGGAVAPTALVWLLLGGAMLAVQGLVYAHYLIGLAVPIVLLAGYGLGWIGERASGGLRASTTALLAVVTLALAVSLVAGAIGGARLAAAAAMHKDQVNTSAAVIRQTAAAGQRMFVWGNEAWLYEAADRQPASEYLYLYPLTTPGYSTAAQVQSLLGELERQPPCVIVDAGSPGLGQAGTPPLLVPRPVVNDGRELDLLEPIRTWVASHYDLVSDDGGWPVYALATSAPGCRLRQHG
jgi:MFS family permease